MSHVTAFEVRRARDDVHVDNDDARQGLQQFLHVFGGIVKITTYSFVEPT